MRTQQFALLSSIGLAMMSIPGCNDSSVRDITVARSEASLSTCITIQHGGAGDIVDTQIASNRPNESYGHLPVANVGTSGGGERRALLRADLSGIPTGASIQSATLTLWQSNTGAGVVKIHRVLVPWDEHTVTWNSLASGYAPEVEASTDNGGPGRPGPIAFNITDLVQAWTSGYNANHGILLAQEPGSATRVHTSEMEEIARRPRLEVCYTPGILPEGTSLLVDVRNQAGTPLSTASITVDGAIHTTDGAGHILFENLTPGRFVARVEARGYAPASVVVDLPADVHAGVEVRLHPLGAPILFDSADGVTLERGPVRVTIPAGALVDYRGEPATGTVEATVVPLDPTVSGLGELPGPLEAVREDGQARVELESLIMAEVSMWQDGLPVHLAPGARARLELRLPEAFANEYTVGDTIPAWWLDLDAGLWREEGAGVIQPAWDDPSKLAWVVDVEHFTWWNCDRPWTDKNCFQVNVMDEDGNPVVNMLVGADGVTYEGGASLSYTNGSGDACVDIKLGNTADIFVGSQFAPLVPLQRVTGSGPASSCSGQGEACTPVTVVLPANLVSCIPGTSQSCSYTGPAATEGVGMCRAGTNYCNVSGTEWLGCQGEVLPVSETCTTPFDDDCDGQANEPDDGLGCECGDGDVTACYTGPPETLSVGVCQAGERTCDTSIGRYGACVGQTLPSWETCTTPEDDDCDGQVNEPLGQICMCSGNIWAGNFSAESQSDLEALRGYSGVTGTLTIEFPVTDWSALDCIEYVGGSVEIELTVPGPSAFSVLTTIGGSLYIENASRPRLDGFGALISIGGQLGLENVTLNALAGFPELRSLGQLSCNGCNIVEISTFAPQLNSMSGLYIEGSTIGTLSGFDSLQSMGGGIWIGEANIGVFTAFGSLRLLGGGFELNSVDIGTMADFNTLQAVGGDFILSSLNSTQIQGFTNLATVRGRFQIAWNRNLRSLVGFNRLGQVDLGISVHGNYRLPPCYVDNLEDIVRANGYTGTFYARNNGEPGSPGCDDLP